MRSREIPLFSLTPLLRHIVKVDADARVQMNDGRAAQNIFAAGEIMAGNVLGKGYLAGIGMTIGAVFGRIAGTEAAAHVGK